MLSGSSTTRRNCFLYIAFSPKCTKDNGQPLPNAVMEKFVSKTSSIGKQEKQTKTHCIILCTLPNHLESHPFSNTLKIWLKQNWKAFKLSDLFKLQAQLKVGKDLGSCFSCWSQKLTNEMQHESTRTDQEGLLTGYVEQ